MRQTIRKPREDSSPTLKKKTKKNEEEQRLESMFYQYDTEGRGILDSYQISKYLEREHHMALPDYVVKQLISEKVMSITSTTIQVKDFIGLHTLIESKKSELTKQQLDQKIDRYQDYFSSLRKANPREYIDFAPPITYVSINEQPDNISTTDALSKSISNQLFKAHPLIPTVSKLHFLPDVIDDETKEMMSSLLSNNDLNSSNNTTLKSTVAPASNGKRRIKRSSLFRHFNVGDPRDTTITFLGNDNELIRNTQLKSYTYHINIQPLRIDVPLKEELRAVFTVFANSKNPFKVTEDFQFDPSKKPPSFAIQLSNGLLNDYDLWAVLYIYRPADSLQTTMRDVYGGTAQQKTKKLDTLMSKQVHTGKWILIGVSAISFWTGQKKKSQMKQFIHDCPVYRDDEFKDINKLLNDIDVNRPLKVISITWTFTIDRLRNAWSDVKGGVQRINEYNLIRPHNIQDNPSSDPTSIDNEAPKLYLLDDISYQTVSTTAATHHFNSLYIYPKELTWKDKKKKPIYLEICVIPNEQSISKDSTYLSWLCPDIQQPPSKKIQSCVKPSSKTIRFSDEFKLIFPDISSEQTDNILCVKIMELSSDGHDDECRAYGLLPLHPPLTFDCTISMNSWPIKAKESIKGSLRLHCIDLASTRPPLQGLSQLVEHRNNMKTFLSDVKEFIQNVPPYKPLCRMYLPTIFNWMIGGCVGSKNLPVVVDFLKVVFGNKTIRDGSLLEYVVDFFDPKEMMEFFPQNEFLFLLLADAVAELLHTRATSPKESVLPYIWFFFGLITKALAVYLSDQQAESRNPEHCYSSPQGIRFEKSVTKIVEYSLQRISELKMSGIETILEVNVFLAQFVRDLMRFWRLQFVVKLIDIVMDWYAIGGHMIEEEDGDDPANTLHSKRNTNEYGLCQILRIDFLGVFNDSPLLFKANYLESPVSFDQLCFAQETILSVIIRNYLMLIIKGDDIQKLAIMGLSLLVVRFDLDTTIQSRENKERLASMLMPIVIYMIEEFDFFKHWHSIDLEKTQEKDKEYLFCIQSLVLCFLYVLKNLKTETLRYYLESEVPTRITLLLQQLIWSLQMTSVRIPSFINPTDKYRSIRLQILKRFSPVPSSNREVFFTMTTRSSSIPTETQPKQHQPQLPRGSTAGLALKKNSIFTKTLKGVKDTITQSSTSTSSTSRRDTRTTIGHKDDPKIPEIQSKASQSTFNERKSIRTDMKNIGRSSTPKVDLPKELTRQSTDDLILHEDQQSSFEDSMGGGDSGDEKRKELLDMIIHDSWLTVMDVAEMVYDVYVEKQSSEHDIQREIEILIVKLLKVSARSVSASKFFRDFFVEFRKSLFTRSVELSLKCVEWLLTLICDEETRTRDDATTLLYLVIKCNFITTGDVALSSSHVSSALVSKALTASGEFTSFAKISAALTELRSRHSADRSWARTEMTTSLEKNAAELHNDVKSARRLRQLYLGLDASAIEEISFYLCKILKEKLTVLNRLSQLPCTYITKRNSLCNDAANLFISSLRFSSDDIQTISDKIETRYAGSNLYVPLTTAFEKLTKTSTDFNTAVESIRIRAEKSSKKYDTITTILSKHSLAVDSIFKWAIKSLEIPDIYQDNLEEVSRRLVVSVPTLREESKKLLEVVIAHENELKSLVTEKELSTLLAVDSLQLNNLITDIVTIHQMQLDLVQEMVDMIQHTTERRIELEKLDEANELMVSENHSAIMKNFCNGPISAEHFKLRANELEILEKQAKELRKLRKMNSGGSSNKGSNSVGGLGVDINDAFYLYWEQICKTTSAAVSQLRGCMEQVIQFDADLKKAQEWHKEDSDNILKVLQSQECVVCSKATLQLELPESHEFFSLVLRIVEDLLVTFTNVQHQSLQIHDIKSLPERFINDEVTLFNASLLNSEQEFDESLIGELGKFRDDMAEKNAIEIKREEDRVAYNTTITAFYEEAQHIIESEKKIDFVLLKNTRDDHSKLASLAKKNTQWINKYVNYTSMNSSVNELFASVKEKGLVKKDDSKHCKTVKTIKITKKQPIYQFLDNNGVFRSEALVDVSPMQQRQFSSDFNELLTTFDDLSTRLDSLRSKLAADDNHEKIYTLAREAVTTPQLHYTWLRKLSEKLGENRLYLEQGLCNVAIVYYIFTALNSCNSSSYNAILKTIAPDILSCAPSTSQPLSAFSENLMIDAANNAIHCFEQSSAYSHAVTVCEFLLAHYTEQNNLERIVFIHQKTNKLYASMATQPAALTLHYYFVRLETTKSSEAEFVYCSSFITHQFRDFINSQHPSVMEVNEVFPIVNNKASHDLRNSVVPVNSFLFEEDAHGTSFETTSVNHFIYTTETKLPSLLSRSPIVHTKQHTLTPAEKVVYDLEKLQDVLCSSDTSIDDKITILRYILTPTERSGLLTIAQTFLDDHLIEQDKDVIRCLYNIICQLADQCKKTLELLHSELSPSDSNRSNTKALTTTRKHFFTFAMFIKSVEAQVESFVELSEDDS
ncbi:EF-hand domain-containing protein [Entamoeba marina]